VEFMIPGTCCTHDDREHMMGRVVLERDADKNKVRMYYSDGEFCPTCRRVLKVEGRGAKDLENQDDLEKLESEWNRFLKDYPEMCFYKRVES